MKNSKQQSQTSATHNLAAYPTLPPTGFLRLPHVLVVFPVSKSAWYAGIKSGLYPQGIKLSPRTVAWSASAVRELIEKTGATQGGQHDKRG